MTSISLPRIPGQGKLAAWLPGARGPPRASGRDLRALGGGTAYGASAHGLRESHRDLGPMGHKVSTPPRQRRACGLGTPVLSPHDTHALTSSLTALHRRP